MGKNKKFKSFAEETAEELSAMKATILKTQEQQGEIFLQFCAADRRSEEFGKKCLKQLSDSANCNLGEFSKALTAHEQDTRKKLYEANMREQSNQQSLNAIATKMDEVGASNSSLSSRVNTLDSKQSQKFRELENKVKALEAALEEEKETALSVQLKLEGRLNELEQLVMMGKAKPKKSKKSVVIDPNEDEPIYFIPQQWAPPIKKKLKELTVTELLGEEEPKNEDPITAELKALEQFCNEKKKQGDAERAKARELPE